MKKLNMVVLAVIFLLASYVMAYAADLWVTSFVNSGNQSWSNPSYGFGTPDGSYSECTVTNDGDQCYSNWYFDDLIDPSSGIGVRVKCAYTRYGTWGWWALIFEDDTTFVLYTQGDPCAGPWPTMSERYMNEGPGVISKLVKGISWGVSENTEDEIIRIDAIKAEGVIGATATPAVTSTPTQIASITPTATPVPCEYVDTGQAALGNPEENALVMGLGDTDLQVTYYGGSGAVVFGDETFYCEDGVPCDLNAENRYPGESFWCYFTGDICANGLYESRAFYCPGGYTLPEFEATGAEGSGVTFSSVGESCLDWVLAEFNLSDFPLLTIIADTFGLTVPEWGWANSTMEICFQKMEVEDLQIGGFDFTPFVVGALAMVVLVIVGWLIRR